MRRMISTLAVFLLVFSLCLPLSVQASSKVKVRYKGVTKSYSKKKTYIFINGEKKDLSTTPVFLKSGAYMGPVDKIFKSSPLKVKIKQSGKKIALTYKNRKLTIKDNSKSAILNGVLEKNALGATPMKGAVYTNTKGSRWVVPLKSVCTRLGISYKISDGIIYLDEVTESQTNSVTNPTPVPVSTEQTINTQAAPPLAASQVVLVIDAGHGGIDSGAAGKLYREKNLNLAIVLAAKQYFDRDSRFKVIYTRTDDSYPSLDDRCKIANNNNADLFICVHINSYLPSSTGTLTLYNNSRNNATKKNGITSRDLALAMQASAVSATGFPDKGLMNRTGLRVLNKTNMPACLIEYGFISNINEERLMYSHTSYYGRKLYEAIEEYMKLKGRIK